MFPLYRTLKIASMLLVTVVQYPSRYSLLRSSTIGVAENTSAAPEPAAAAAPAAPPPFAEYNHHNLRRLGTMFSLIVEHRHSRGRGRCERNGSVRSDDGLDGGIER